jgi:hypothetical protein
MIKCYIFQICLIYIIYTILSCAITHEIKRQAGAERCQAQVKLGGDWLTCKLFLIGNLNSTFGIS